MWLKSIVETIFFGFIFLMVFGNGADDIVKVIRAINGNEVKVEQKQEQPAPKKKDDNDIKSDW